MNEEQPETGTRGLAITLMMPSGKVLISGNEYSATLRSGYANPGDEVVVVELNAFGLIVEKPNSPGVSPSK